MVVAVLMIDDDDDDDHAGEMMPKSRTIPPNADLGTQAAQLAEERRGCVVVATLCKEDKT